MHSSSDLRVVAPSGLAEPILAALRLARLPGSTLTPRQALHSPGACLGARLVVWGFHPGAHPPLEAEAFAGGICGLYAHAGADRAELGPITSAGSGPCPRCLDGSVAEVDAGADRALTAWLAAWVALECDAIMRAGSSELLGASWRWSRSEPGLTLVRWARNSQCPTAGCA